MSVYKRPESSRYVIEIRWQGLPRLKLSTGSSSKKLAEAMQRTLHGLKDAGRLDVLRLLAEGKLRLADVTKTTCGTQRRCSTVSQQLPVRLSGRYSTNGLRGSTILRP